MDTDDDDSFPEVKAVSYIKAMPRLLFSVNSSIDSFYVIAVLLTFPSRKSYFVNDTIVFCVKTTFTY